MPIKLKLETPIFIREEIIAFIKKYGSLSLHVYKIDERGNLIKAPEPLDGYNFNDIPNGYVATLRLNCIDNAVTKAVIDGEISNIPPELEDWILRAGRLETTAFIQINADDLPRNLRYSYPLKKQEVASIIKELRELRAYSDPDCLETELLSAGFVFCPSGKASRNVLVINHFLLQKHQPALEERRVLISKLVENPTELDIQRAAEIGYNFFWDFFLRAADLMYEGSLLPLPENPLQNLDTDTDTVMEVIKRTYPTQQSIYTFCEIYIQTLLFFHQIVPQLDTSDMAATILATLRAEKTELLPIIERLQKTYPGLQESFAKVLVSFENVQRVILEKQQELTQAEGTPGYLVEN